MTSSEHNKIYKILDLICSGVEEFEKYKYAFPETFLYNSEKITGIRSPHNKNDLLQFRALRRLVGSEDTDCVSFIRSDSQRKMSINTSISYSTGDILRIGDDFFNIKEFTSDFMFQFSLVNSNYILEDLEFILYLKSMDFKYNIQFIGQSYNFDVLESILYEFEKVPRYEYINGKAL